MVKNATAVSIVKDTAGVRLERVLVSLNGDRKSTSHKSCLHLVRVSCCDTNIAGSANTSAVNLMASAINTHVGVCSFIHGVMIFEVLVSVFLHTTIATSAISDAVNELLLGELLKCAGRNGITVLDSLQRAESPA